MKKRRKFHNIAGSKFNRLLAIGRSEVRAKGGGYLWLFKCDCGNDYFSYPSAVATGVRKSCGCYNREAAAKRMRKIARKHGLANSPENRAWSEMKRRCLDPKRMAYKDYGGRGIKVCDRWLNSFENFFKDMGKSPSPKHSLDRIDNSKGYYPDNCRWATKNEQSNNRRNNRRLRFMGKTMTVSQWAKELGIDRRVIESRINKLKWPVRAALSIPTGSLIGKLKRN